MVETITDPDFCAPQLSRASPNHLLPLFILSEREGLSMQMRPQISDPALALGQAPLPEMSVGRGGAVWGQGWESQL